MIRINRARISRALAIIATMLSGEVAFAQIDLSGDWAVRIHMDQAWRGPGAE